MEKKLKILLTNDDGFFAPGINALFARLKEFADPVMVAPASEKSGCSRSITLFKELEVKEEKQNIYSVNGTPTDCVMLALNGLLDFTPDLILSGINRGANLASDITYSGTVAGAMEGARNEIPSIAFSLSDYNYDNYDYSAEVAVRIIKSGFYRQLPASRFLNVNIPGKPLEEIKGTKITKLGLRYYDNPVETIKEKENFFKITGHPVDCNSEDTDVRAINDSYISITPLNLDLTDPELLSILKDKKLEIL